VLTHINHGNQLVQSERYDEAIAEYKQAEALAGKPLFSIYLAMGSAYYGKKDFKTAAETYKRAIEIRSNDFRGHFNLAESLFAAGDYAEAEKAYRKALTFNPRSVEAQIHEFLGLSLYQQKRIDEAIAEYKIAIDRAGGKYSEANYNLGIALMDRGDLPGAESAFRNAIQQDKQGLPQARYNLGLVLERQNRIADAVREYEAYLRGRPDAPDAESLRMHIDRLLKQK